MAKPIKTVNPIKLIHTNIAPLLFKTALTLLTTAVKESTLRSMIMGKEKALTANTSTTKIAPIALPIARNGSSSCHVGFASTGKKICTIAAARAHTNNTISNTKPSTIRPRTWCQPSWMQWPMKGARLASNWRLMEYRPTANIGPTNTKPVAKPKYKGSVP